MYDHVFGTVHWSLVALSVDIQMKNGIPHPLEPVLKGL